MHESSYKLKAYTDLLNAVTEINLSVGTLQDGYREKEPGTHAQPVNLIASSGVLKSVNDLLDFLNEHKEKDFDTLRSP